MLRKNLRLAALFLGVAILPVAAASEAVVHAVQPPAWIERAGGIVALAAGAPLLAGDVIRTGPGGRVQVDLPEGSRVKLGEQVRFRATRMQRKRDAQGGFFDGVFEVLKGAFRFTTGLAGREQRRDVRFRVGVVTAGIRGTDIWGKSTEDGGDMVLLLEGKVELAMPGHAAMLMTQAAHGVMMMPGGEMRLMDAMPADLIEQYARETGMNPDRAMMMSSGEWQLVLMSLRDRANAETLRENLVQAGYPAEIVDVSLDSGAWHRVVLSRLASPADARMQGEALIGRHGIEAFWIRRDWKAT